MVRLAKTAIQRALGTLGYRLVRLDPGRKREALPRDQRPVYEDVRPIASYAPWNADSLFLSTYEIIKGHTLVDIYRCWELWTLVGQSAKLTGGIIEIGVWRGGTGGLIATKAAHCGIQEPVYLCDTFRGVVKAGAHDTYYKGGEHADTSRSQVEALISERLGLTNVRIREGVFPEATATSIEDEQKDFRLCHIDVDVYQSAKEILAWIWSRIVVGGIVVYDDYGFKGCEGITKFVNEQAGEDDRLVLHNLNGHAIVVKISQRQGACLAAAASTGSGGPPA